MHQVLFQVPGTELSVHGFGVMLFVAFLTAFLFAMRWAPRQGIPREVIQDLSYWLIIGGILGARSAYLLLDPNGQAQAKTVKQFLIRLPQIWEGGIVLYGSFVGGLVAYVLFYLVSLRKKAISTWAIADVLAVMLALGLLFGRLGCFLNGCCYGQVANQKCLKVGYPLSAAARYDLVKKGYQTPAGFLLAPGGEPIVAQVRPDSAAARSGLKIGDRIVKINQQEVRNAAKVSSVFAFNWGKGEKDLTLTVDRNGETIVLPTFQPRTLGVHPTQLYESVNMGVLFLLLMAFYPLRRSDGQVMALFMMCYGIHRSFNEMLRRDERPEGFEQYVSWVLAGLGAAIMVYLWYRPRFQTAPAAEESGTVAEQSPKVGEPA